MPEGPTPLDVLFRWQESQRTFWRAAAGEPAFEDASAFALLDWQAFDGVVEHMLRGLSWDSPGIDLVEVHAACARHRDILTATWMRIRETFEAHRRAVWDPSSPPDWRVLRDRWFQIAEAEFIQTQRSPEFVEAQRDVIRAVVTLWSALPAEVREAIGLQRQAAQTIHETMSDLGVNLVPVAQTPKEVVWAEANTTLSRYLPLGRNAPTLGPLLICHGLIGRQTMTDLRPDRSLVRNLLAQGVDVFVVDWGRPGPQDAGQGLDHYVGRLIPTLIEKTLAAGGAERLTLFGICQGGTLSAIHAARDAKGLAGLITAVAPFDFHADVHDADPAHGLIHLWARSLGAEDVEGLLCLNGNLSGELLGMVFSQLNPIRTLRKYAVQMLETGQDPSALTTFMAMEKWLADRPDLPGALARTWLGELYRENALIKGDLQVNGRRIALSSINVPVLNVFATGDHITPAPCSRALSMLLQNAQYRELALPTGHIGAFVSQRAQALLAPAIVRFLEDLSALNPPQ